MPHPDMLHTLPKYVKGINTKFTDNLFDRMLPLDHPDLPIPGPTLTLELDRFEGVRSGGKGQCLKPP